MSDDKLKLLQLAERMANAEAEYQLAQHDKWRAVKRYDDADEVRSQIVKEFGAAALGDNIGPKERVFRYGDKMIRVECSGGRFYVTVLKAEDLR